MCAAGSTHTLENYVKLEKNNVIKFISSLFLLENNVGYHDILRTTSRDRRQLADFKSEPLVYDVFYEGCGTVKNCFGYPPGCLKTMNCRAVTSVTVQGDKYTFQMQAMNAKYVATGLSEDRMMVTIFFFRYKTANLRLSYNDEGEIMISFFFFCCLNA